ncbi:hypothetical protein SNEBB_009858 [Seison nebaliae]|nr:hypothetical protein SNEBB_009858 [Seison nebaliae]
MDFVDSSGILSGSDFVPFEIGDSLEKFQFSSSIDSEPAYVWFYYFFLLFIIFLFIVWLYVRYRSRVGKCKELYKFLTVDLPEVKGEEVILNVAEPLGITDKQPEELNLLEMGLPSENLGQLVFSIQFDGTEKLFITLIKGQNLFLQEKLRHEPNTHILVELFPKEMAKPFKAKSRKCYGTSPEYHQSFSFKVALENLHHLYLKLTVLEKKEEYGVVIYSFNQHPATKAIALGTCLTRNIRYPDLDYTVSLKLKVDLVNDKTLTVKITSMKLKFFEEELTIFVRIYFLRFGEIKSGKEGEEITVKNGHTQNYQNTFEFKGDKLLRSIVMKTATLMIEVVSKKEDTSDVIGKLFIGPKTTIDFDEAFALDYDWFQCD